MDTNKEEKIYHQIEKNLSNNMNENLFMTGRVFELEKPTKGNFIFDNPVSGNRTGNLEQEDTKESIDYINQSPTLSRAEYIRQARESCLRQLSTTQNYNKAWDSIDSEAEVPSSDLLHKKKANISKLFREGEKTLGEENTTNELASFHSLIIRTVCAIVLFLSIFAFDKLEAKVGGFSFEAVKEYVTGNDYLQELEDIFVTWLK